MQLQLAPLNGVGAGGRDEGARPYTAAAAVTVMFSPHREINGTVLEHRLHARAAEQSLLVDAPTQRRLGPMISGKVLLNPVSLPLNALIKKEKPVAYVREPKM